MVLAALASVAGSALLNKVTGGTKGRGGTAADPNMYPNIRIPGASFQENTPTIDMPYYSSSMGYEAPILPYNNPVLEAQLAPSTMGEQGQGRALTQSEALMMTLLDPNSKITQGLARQEEELSRQDFLTNLRSIMTANKRQRARGGAGLFNPERRDDDVLMSILNNARDSRQQGRMRAEEKIKNAASGMGTLAGQYGQYAGTEQTRRNAYRNDLSERLNQLRSDAASRLQQATGNFERGRSDQKEIVDQKREDYINALRFARSGMADQATAESAYRQNQALNQSNQLSSAVSGLFSAFSGGNKGNLSGLPWKG